VERREDEAGFGSVPWYERADVTSAVCGDQTVYGADGQFEMVGGEAILRAALLRTSGPATCSNLAVAGEIVLNQILAFQVPVG
jgi:hypothetical protein